MLLLRWDISHSVLAYSLSSAHLKLGHDYPQDTNVTAVVDVNLVLQTLGHEQTRVGEWVNVVGYVTAKRRASKPDPGGLSVHVQALIVWSTGPLDVQKYEKTFDRDTV